jgi:hypothetical protein
VGSPLGRPWIQNVVLFGLTQEHALDSEWAMWATTSRPKREPQWVKIAHALLIYGDDRVRRERWPTQELFWPLVLGLDGKGISRNTGLAALSRLEGEGQYFRRPLELTRVR